MSDESNGPEVKRDTADVETVTLTPARPLRSPWGYDAYPAAAVARAELKPRLRANAARYRGRVRYHIEGEFVREWEI